MRSVNDLLSVKGSEVWAVSPDSTVYDALKMMADKNIGAVIVMEGETLAGIFSERDYARKVVLQGKFSREILVREIMTGEVVSVRPDQSIQDCMALMTQGRFRHLPVLDDEGRLRGLISIGDVVRAVVSEQEFMIHQLENFIGGGR